MKSACAVPAGTVYSPWHINALLWANMMLLYYTLLSKCADLRPEHNNTVEYKPQPQHLAVPTGMLFHLEPFRHMAAKWRRAPTKKSGRGLSKYCWFSTCDPHCVCDSDDMAGILFEDIFDVKDIDPDGKKFERGENILFVCFRTLLERQTQSSASRTSETQIWHFVPQLNA